MLKNISSLKMRNIYFWPRTLDIYASNPGHFHWKPSRCVAPIHKKKYPQNIADVEHFNYEGIKHISSNLTDTWCFHRTVTRKNYIRGDAYGDGDKKRGKNEGLFPLEIIFCVILFARVNMSEGSDVASHTLCCLYALTVILLT